MSDRTIEPCLVCASPGAKVWHEASHDNLWIDCEACGKFVADGFVKTVGGVGAFGKWWTQPRRAALSHYIRTRRDLPVSLGKEGRPYLSRDDLARFEENGIALPSRLIQMDNAIRYLGDEESINGEPPFETPVGLWALIGSANSDSMANLLMDMVTEGYISNEANRDREFGEVSSVTNARLSLRGWKRFEEIRQGETRSSDGFIAMQFSDDYVGSFIRNTVQKGLQDALGVAVHRLDSPDKLEAGLIDNIMREAIENAAFVLVELSHGNRGAYWEAGLAEGLGKPVIYLCEDAVWRSDDKAKKPHFDVLHRQTVMWNREAPDECLPNLIATIRNSLRIKRRGKEKAG